MSGKTLLKVVFCLSLVFTGYQAYAFDLHNFECDNCHTANLSAKAAGATNLCLKCHEVTSPPSPTMGYKDAVSDTRGDVNPAGTFAQADASDAFGNATGSAAQTSHNWSATESNRAAGARSSTTAIYNTRYRITRGWVACSKCHNPHAEYSGSSGPGLNTTLWVDNSADQICLDCHREWDKPIGNSGFETHPLVADYAAAQAGNPTILEATLVNANNGDVRLVNGGVSCTSCHATHFADSNSDTVDGMGATLTSSDDRIASADQSGALLRADGPERLGGTREGATGTAQLRSNLCQACHKHQLHGRAGGDDAQIGCLDCHGGHSYNGGMPSAYVLSTDTLDLVPTRSNAAADIDKQITWPPYPVVPPIDIRNLWADEWEGGATGYCEQCHGDVNADPIKSQTAGGEHTVGHGTQCDSCHVHNDPSQFSFAVDASAATCGACHGFPPYLNVEGDRDDTVTPGTEGGYAVNYVDPDPAQWDYVNNTTYEKDETLTGHKTHAGAGLPGDTGEWYFVGTSGIENCEVCHGSGAGNVNHREDPNTFTDTFRNVPFGGIADAGGNLSPVYDHSGIGGNDTCLNTYCHSNGFPRVGPSAPNRNYAAAGATIETPQWVGNGWTGNPSTSHGFEAYTDPTNTGRCATCHGNTSGTMTSRSGSAVHNVHLDHAAINNDCSLCHVDTATGNTTLAAGVTDGKNGTGIHINNIVEVNYPSSGSNLRTALDPAANLTGVNYDSNTGTCAIYCHDPDDSGNTADWDVSGALNCDDCHGGTNADTNADGGVGPITTGSHARHITNVGNGPELLCSVCHGTNADAGTHSGHIDGIVDVIPETDSINFNSLCEECHGYDSEFAGQPLGEVLPVWGNNSTTDCATCHAGLLTGGDVQGFGPPGVQNARLGGHNRPTASGTYPQSGNAAAHVDCEDCHLSDSALHWDQSPGDYMLRTDLGFPADYSLDENGFCLNCHGVLDATHTKEASINTDNMVTHQSKDCIACHNVHGDQNIQMIWRSYTDQNLKDTSLTGEYASANVFFTQTTTFNTDGVPDPGTDSYDEDDGAAGAAGEGAAANHDDICATCHSDASGTTHNNREGTDNQGPTGHNIGYDCNDCHTPHDDAAEAFIVAAGTACNDCHGYPPDTGAHGNGANLHSRITDPADLVNEDRTDCAYCHTGADLYTFDTGADQAAGGARGNHAVSRDNRQTVLTNNVNVGFNNNGTPSDSSDDYCASACHNSSLTDGFWTDTTAGGNSGNGLNCDACHYYSGSPNSGDTPTGLTVSHDEHFDKTKNCTECHNVENGGASVPGGLAHIGSFDFGTGNDGNDGAALLDMATVEQNEAGAGANGVTRTGMTFNAGIADAGGVNNTCADAFTTGCHASGGDVGGSGADWDVAIPANSSGCVQCHDNTDDAAYNPTSGLHDNNPAPTVTAESHDGDFDGSTADCVTCHTTSPTGTASDHINGSLQSGASINVTVPGGSYTPGAPGTCTTSCHSVGTTWAYLWTTDAYNSNATECYGCHGTYGNTWNAGVVHNEAGNETRGSLHNTTGTLTYPCADCHAIGATTGNYNWTSMWDPSGLTSDHGDGVITMNDSGNVTPNETTRAGCTTTDCHNNDAAHSFLITSTGLLRTPYVIGDDVVMACSNCHGGTIGTDADGYWPNGSGNENDSGAHLAHMTALASSVYSEDIATLLTNNGNGTSDAKQKELCTYCHETPGADGDHGDPANLPAETWATTNDTNIAGNGYYELWEAPRVDRDSADYNPAGNGTCSQVACHGGKTTPATNEWYDVAGNSTCAMCHVDIPTETGHAPHLDAGVTAGGAFGRDIDCADCHHSATDWAGNTAPGDGAHIDGTVQVQNGAVTFTYDGGNSCGTNDCHNAGNGGSGTQPAQLPYVWANDYADDCVICHAATPTVTAAHAPHLGNTDYVPGSCNECHDAANIATHIDATVDFGGAVTAPLTNTAWNGSCTNNCHTAGDAGDWTGGAAAMACIDCHSGSFVGGNNWRASGNNYLHASGLHVTSAANVTPHNETMGGCVDCHTAYGSEPASHVDGFWQVDLDAAPQTEDRFLKAGAMIYGEQPPNSSTCSGTGQTIGSCHSDGGNWGRLWSTDADVDYVTNKATGQAVCGVCHGVYASIAPNNGWRTGTVHFTSGGTKGSGHTDANLECEDCHAYPSAFNHEDGFIQFADDENVDPLTGNNFQLAWGTHGTNPGWYCASCHDGAIAEDAQNATSHTFVDSAAFPSATKVPTHEGIRYAQGVSTPEGGCTGCHGNPGTGGYWPDGSKTGTREPGSSGPADRPGKHAEHVQAIGDEINGGGPGSATVSDKNLSCVYCHPNPGGGGHNDAAGPADLPDNVTKYFFRIIGATNDGDGTVNGSGTSSVTCSTIDCHFNNAVTPHWYDDAVLPGTTTLTASTPPASPDPDYVPRAVKLSWTAPGDDAQVAWTTPYVYDIRISSDGDPRFPAVGTETDFGRTDNYVGGMPAAYRQGFLTEMHVEGLLPNISYTFSMRTRDTFGNWSLASTPTTATSTDDSTLPDFTGVDDADPGDESATINVYWTPAEDHTMPITYDIYIKDEENFIVTNPLDLSEVFSSPDATIPDWEDHKIQLDFANAGIADDHIYHIGVRACDDALPQNCETNTQTVSATPTAPPTVGKTYPNYVSNNSRVMTEGAGWGTSATVALAPSVEFFAANPYAAKTKLFSDTFAVHLANSDRRNAQTIEVEIGYSLDGSSWAGTKSVTKQVSLGGNANRVVSFKILDLTGVTFNASEYLAVRVTDVGASAKVDISYGSATTGGNLTGSEQLVNELPIVPTITSAVLTNGIVDMTWTQSDDPNDGIADTVHYDLYGNDGTNDYLIAAGLDVTTTNYSWNTQVAGITGGSVTVTVNAGDGFDHSTDSSVAGTANANDEVAPSQITDLSAKKRPKSGTVWLTWTAPGDDLDNHGRAEYYDIRYSSVSAADVTTNWATLSQATHEPVPDFGGETQNYEVTGLTPNASYWFGIRTVDESGNISPISNVGTQVGGPRCGMCHTTAPSVDESVGNHKLHGFTLGDCDNCHTEDPAGANIKPSDYTLGHQDGRLVMGYGDLGAFEAATTTASRILYTHDGTGGGQPLYDDGDGANGGGGGFNDPADPFVPLGDGIDNGNCFNFGNRTAGGCHGPAGNDADGWGNASDDSAPYIAPGWNEAATQDCANCHGTPVRTTDSTYARHFDSTLDAWEAGGSIPGTEDTYVNDQVKGTPPIDNHGLSSGKYVGQHEKHLNYSFRFAKGDNCNLCHAGKYAERNNLDGKHANGTIDVVLNKVAAGDDATYIPGDPGPSSCSNLSAESCHPKDVLAGGSAPTPQWDSGQTFQCIECHGMDGSVPSHVTDPANNIDDITMLGDPDTGDQRPGNCTWCHFGGHPRSDEGGASLILANSSQVGINYRSGGIHLRKSIGGRPSYQTEAELCWGCHDSQTPRVSEWNADDWNPNANTVAPNTSEPDYDFGYVGTNISSNWYADMTPGSEVGATWTSANFAYKSAPIQSIHTTNEAGTSLVNGVAGSRQEVLDAVANIRCSNCHDVHDLAKAPGDTAEGAPYLRGSWIRNPYPEDGAPFAGQTYGTPNNFNAVPRGGNQHNEMGGYQIDQNNGNPTSGLSLATSGGLCTLCHGTDVDNMDKRLTEGFWVGAGGNGHSNAALGGTGTNASNIFNTDDRHPTTAPVTFAGSYDDGGNPNMAYQNAADRSTSTRAGGFRSTYSSGSYGFNVTPLISADFAYLDYNWGASQGPAADNPDIGYHAFTCSKCHNPHASRLPKLMITNCLDTKKNTWDNGRTIPTSGAQATAATENDGVDLSNATSAQNCHRVNDPTFGKGGGAGWNTVTPWDGAL